VPESTLELWQRQDRLVGDRRPLYASVAEELEARTVLYPGSYVDVAPSFVFDDVTYVDTDRRANRFFGDVDGVADIIRTETPDRSPSFAFVHGDYTDHLALPSDHYDLLISLYAGFVSEHCGQHLRVGGTLLVNSSHGDAAMASIDDRFELAGVVDSQGDRHRVVTRDLDAYLVPKRPITITRESLHELGRGIAYTTSPFAYLFTRVH